MKITITGREIKITATPLKDEHHIVDLVANELNSYGYAGTSLSTGGLYGYALVLPVGITHSQARIAANECVIYAKDKAKQAAEREEAHMVRMRLINYINALEDVIGCEKRVLMSLCDYSDSAVTLSLLADLLSKDYGYTNTNYLLGSLSDYTTEQLKGLVNTISKYKLSPKLTAEGYTRKLEAIGLTTQELAINAGVDVDVSATWAHNCPVWVDDYMTYQVLKTAGVL